MWTAYGGGVNWAVSASGMGGGELGVYAPRCSSDFLGTPSRWEWRSNETAPGMSSLRAVAS